MKSLIFAATIVSLAGFTGCAGLRHHSFFGHAGTSYCHDCNEFSGDGIPYEGQYFPADEPLNALELPTPEEISAPPAV